MSWNGAGVRYFSGWKETLFWGLLLLGIGLVHSYFLRPGHFWGDDFAQYLMHAQNLAEGRPHSQTGYIYNPHYPQIGPPAYPPGTALLLAPVYRIWGLNWTALKGTMIGCLLVFLALLVVYFRRSLSLGVLTVLVVLIGLNHFFLDQTNAIGSDLPFLVWVYLTLVFFQQGDRGEDRQERFRQHGESRSEKEERPFAGRILVWHLAAALAAWAAFATRTVGVVLWAAILLADAFQHRRIRSSLVWASGVFLLLAALQTLLIPGTSGYFDQLSIDPALLASHAVQYARQLAAFWRNGFSKLLTAVVAGIVSLLALVGYYRECRRRVSVREIFLLLYGVVVAAWPSYQGFRMLDPVVPLWLFYAWKGIESDWPKRWDRLRFAAAVGLAGVMAACYGTMLLTRPTGPLPEGIGRPSSQELFQAVRQYTKPDDALVFIKPRVLALLTGRRCSVYHPVQDDAELWAYFRQIQARFLVVVQRPEAMQGAEELERVQFLADFAARNQRRLQPIWANDDFALYRIEK